MLLLVRVAAAAVLLLLLCCCSCATLIMCLCFVLEVGNVHVAFFFKTDLTTFLPSRSEGFGNADERATLLVLLLLCCCSCATLIMCVSALYSQVVQFHLGAGSCACILPQKSTVLLCCVVPPVVAHLKKTQALGWNLKVYSPNKMKGKSRRRHRCCLCYRCSFAASAVLCCCCCVSLIIWVCFVFRLRRFISYTCGTSCSPQHIRT